MDGVRCVNYARHATGGKNVVADLNLTDTRKVTKSRVRQQDATTNAPKQHHTARYS